MDTTRNPEIMTVAERRAEVASIIAVGLVRTMRQARMRQSPPVEGAPAADNSELDLCANLPLSVTPRPAGSRSGL